MSNSSQSVIEVCPPCPNCSVEFANCSLYLDEGGGTGYGDGFDYSSFTNSPSVGEPVNSTLEYEIYYRDSLGTLTLTDPYFITYGSIADLEDKVKEFLENTLGGVWTVTCADIGGDIVITNIVGVASVYEMIEFSAYDDDGVWSDHSFSSSAYIDPTLEVVIPLLADVLPTISDSPCLNEGEIDVTIASKFDPTFDPTFADDSARLYYWIQINASSITGRIEIYDKSNNLISWADYSYTDPPIDPSGYQCDKRYVIPLTASGSISTPRNGRGPVGGPIHDWSGSQHLTINNNELPPA